MIHKLVHTSVALSFFATLSSAAVAEITFNSDFECGNGQGFQLIGENHYQVEFDPETNAKDSQWFYFEVNGAAGKLLTFDLLEVDKTNVPKHWKTAVPVYSNDLGTTWERLTTTSLVNDSTFTFSHEFTTDTVRLAFHDPYTVTRVESKIAGWKQSHYCTAEIIGESVEKRPLTHLTITDVSIPNEGKVGVWVIARQHAAEVTGSYVMEGMVDYLLSDDPGAKLLRTKTVFNVIPMVNPDGVYAGNYRQNVNGINLNRVWNGTASFTKSPEVAYVQKAIKEWVDGGNNYTYFFDLHSTSGTEPHFAFHSTASQTSVEYNARLTQFLKYVETHAPVVDSSIGKSDSLNTQLAEDSNYNAYGVLAFTFEAGYNYVSHGPNPDAYMTPDVHRSVGVGIAKAVVSMEGW